MAIRPHVLAAALLTVPLSAATITVSKPEASGMSSLTWGSAPNPGSSLAGTPAPRSARRIALPRV